MQSSRRIIRIKVLQVLYAYEIAKDHIDKVKKVNVQNINIIRTARLFRQQLFAHLAQNFNEICVFRAIALFQFHPDLARQGGEFSSGGDGYEQVPSAYHCR